MNYFDSYEGKMTFSNINFDLNEYIIDNSTCQLENVSKMCRCCFIASDNDIFTKKFNGTYLYEILEKCASVKIEKDENFPNNMCNICINQLIKSYLFISKYSKSQQILYDFLVNKKSQNNIKKTDTSTEENDVATICKEEEYRNADNNLLCCSFCNESFDSIKQLRQHRKSVKHPRPKKFLCNLCSKGFPYKAALDKHMRTHTKEKPYQCELCSMKFSLVRNLKRHKMIHTGERPYICDICGKGFIQEITLIEHKRVHTGETPFICSYCGKGFKRSSELKSHTIKHLIESEEMTETKQQILRQVKCDICNKILSSRAVLRTHQLVHGEKTFLCSNCGKGFVSKLALHSHMKVHSGERPYSCNFCEKSFAQPSTLKDHLLIHSGERPHVCKVCNKSFVQRNHLVYHLRTHSGEKPYSCVYCGKAFAVKGNLTVHIRIHTGECPYICRVCEKGFCSSSSMKKHQKTHGENVT